VPKVLWTIVEVVAKVNFSVSFRYVASLCNSGRRQVKVIKLALRDLLAKYTKAD